MFSLVEIDQQFGYIYPLRTTGNMWHKETRLGENTARYPEHFGPYFFTIEAAKEALMGCPMHVIVLQISDDGGLERLWAYADQAEFLKPLQKWAGCYGHVIVSELQEV